MDKLTMRQQILLLAITPEGFSPRTKGQFGALRVLLGNGLVYTNGAGRYYLTPAGSETCVEILAQDMLPPPSAEPPSQPMASGVQECSTATGA